MAKYGLKRPRTTQERREGENHPELVRGKRRPHRLANAWDDKPTARQPRDDRYKNNR